MTEIARPIVHVAAMAALALLTRGTTGCAVGCTLVGCDSGLTVRVQPPPTVAHLIEVVASVSSARYLWRFDDASRCGAGNTFFPNYLGKRAVVVVIVGADTTLREFTDIRYGKLEPNGPQCDPTCRQAEVVVPLGQ